ncbi:hypothetical protein NAL32_16830 [Chryseobacterium sp. Ch-15]|uniref:Lipoprotein n=1 Tax=Chryseobacterium muglaense TaxID=2893752 RepID=A0A9Q3UR50_9FLAO|nr:hypothetical protein [Chryseobacterium muglaense]MBD3906352.1 hypothetical protein [Chryseobacterium muglaense]MCC9033619.1 hypothetical protein [Chryseobacterium muglaense]MCM2556051.1 hypothetical protein [Chryseobacterium muglaense]
MAKYIFLVIVLMLVSCKAYKIKNVYFKSETLKVNSKIVRIDSTENDYVYFLKNDTMQAFFTKAKSCLKNFETLIDTTKKYQLTVQSDAKFNYLSKTYSEVYYHDGIDTSFNYKDYRLILLDSPDICGKTVDCKENLEFKEKFFESIKFIDTLIYSIQGRKFNEALNFISKYSHVSSESMLNYARIYPGGVYEKDRKIWIDWYEKNKCTNIQFKE